MQVAVVSVQFGILLLVGASLILVSSTPTDVTTSTPTITTTPADEITSTPTIATTPTDVTTPTTTITTTIEENLLYYLSGNPYRLHHCNTTYGSEDKPPTRENAGDNVITLTMLLLQSGEYLLNKSSLKYRHRIVPDVGYTAETLQIGEKTSTTDGVASKEVVTQRGTTLKRVRTGKDAGTTTWAFSPDRLKVTDRKSNFTKVCFYKKFDLLELYQF